MPAVSKKQQRYMGMVHAVQKGDMKAPSAAVAETASSISPSDATEFASTKTKGLPMKKESNVLSSVLGTLPAVGAAGGAGLGAYGGAQLLPAVFKALPPEEQANMLKMVIGDPTGMSRLNGGLSAAGAVGGGLAGYLGGKVPGAIHRYVSPKAYQEPPVEVEKPAMSKQAAAVSTFFNRAVPASFVVKLAASQHPAIREFTQKAASLAEPPSTQNMANYLDCVVKLNPQLGVLKQASAQLRQGKSVVTAFSTAYPKMSKEARVKVAARLISTYLQAHRQVVAAHS